MNIVVLAGGLSAERDVSVCTGEMVCNALKKRGHNAVLVDLFLGLEGENNNWNEVFKNSRNNLEKIDKVGDTAPDINKLRNLRNDNSRIGDNVIDICKVCDIVFMALHGEDGENGKVQAAFDLLGIKYTGSGYFGSAIAMNKVISKQIFTENDILTPDYDIISKTDFKSKIIDMKFPCVVKPSSGGSSIGVSIVNTEDEIKDAIEKASVYEDEIIVEPYIKGREFSVGVLGDMVLPIIEIIPKHGFYDYVTKYQKGFAIDICPANLDDVITKRMQDMAFRAHKALNLQVYSRTDFILDDKDNIYCLESNTLPGMTPTSLLPQEAAAVGIEYEKLCEKIINLSLSRFK